MSFDLIATPEQAKDAIKEMAQRRYTAAANQGQERAAYRRALQQATKGKAPMRSRSVVIARCEESLVWTEEIHRGIQVIIYDKGEGGAVANIGREAHTYFKHIVDNYYRMTDVTFFLQGWPLDRSSCVLDGVNYLSNFDFIEFGSDILETGPLEEPLITFWNHIFEEPMPERSWAFRANSQFGVNRLRIYKWHVDFYKRCLQACIHGLPGVDVKSMPYLFEQVWWKVFGP